MSFDLPNRIDDRPVAVIGGGTLGRRIALMMTLQGGVVHLYSRSAETRAAAVEFVQQEQPALVQQDQRFRAGQVRAVDNLADAVAGAWWVVETVAEQLEVKQAIFRELDALAPPDAVLSTNSSSYASSHLVGSVRNPARLLNTHFLTPPEMVPVELMSCGQTDPRVIALMAEALPRFGLSPYIAQAESTGFIFNRIWAAVKRETLMVLAEGVADAATIDGLYREATKQPWGPCELMDAVGLDVVLDIERHYAQERPHLPESPRRLLEQMVQKGQLGVKSGRGFYDYSEGQGQ